MAHFLDLVDQDGELVDVAVLCSDACHRAYAAAVGVPYEGWHGANEIDHTEWCLNCGVVVPGTDTECREQLENVVVNRIPTMGSRHCVEHDGKHIIQLGRMFL